MRQKRPKGEVIQNTAIIAVVITAVFVSQLPYVKSAAVKITGQVERQASGFLPKNTGQFFADLSLKAGGGARALQASAQQQITTQKNNAVQNVWENFKHYFAQKFNTVFATKVE